MPKAEYSSTRIYLSELHSNCQQKAVSLKLRISDSLQNNDGKKSTLPIFGIERYSQRHKMFEEVVELYHDQVDAFRMDV